jgi:hypothetical protein
LAHPSKALEEFLVSLGAVERLGRIEARLADPPTDYSAPTVEALRGGFCVLIVASFERYLTEGFAEHLGALVGKPPPVPLASLPEPLRVSSVFESLEYAMRGPRRGSSTARKRRGRYRDVLKATQVIVDGNVDPEALAQTRSNPGPETIKGLFKALGISDPFSEIRGVFDSVWGQPEASTFVTDQLAAIINRRNIVAHTANALNISRAELAWWPLFFRAITTSVDERLDRYSRNILSRVSPP